MNLKPLKSLKSELRAQESELIRTKEKIETYQNELPKLEANIAEYKRIIALIEQHEETK